MTVGQILKDQCSLFSEHHKFLNIIQKIKRFNLLNNQLIKTPKQNTKGLSKA